MSAEAARVQRDGSTLAFAGALTRAAVPAVWPAALTALDGVRAFDLSAVSAVDSAGLALLVELAERTAGVQVSGDPAGLDGLRRAYRLSPQLSFARA